MIKFDREELVSKLSNIIISLEGDEVATYYEDRQVSRTRVSGKYEIFDFKPFVIKCIDEVQDNYSIEGYTLVLVGGRQEIRLYSEPEIIDGEEFRRTFYLLNSSDKTRALSFSYGLNHNKFHFISKKGTIYKKHYTGITKYVEDKIDLDDSIFSEQILILKKIIGDSILMSDVQKVITESDTLDKSKVSLRGNFDRFIDILYRSSKGVIDDDNRKKLYTNSWSRRLTDYTKKDNFKIDSFLVFKTYLEMFNNRDASEIKRESERIMKLGVVEKRNDVIDQLLCL